MLEQADVDVASATQVQQQIWSKGDFARVAPIVQVVADRLVESVDVLPGDRVLDVSCGSGNTAIAAARCFAEVTGIDFVSALLERARKRAAAEFLEIEMTYCLSALGVLQTTGKRGNAIVHRRTDRVDPPKTDSLHAGELRDRPTRFLNA